MNEDEHCKEKVGYIPAFPAPVTEYNTVYTALTNFNDLLTQLDQKYLPVTCDEGVYRVAKESRQKISLEIHRSSLTISM